jgi:hypothetical protein
MENYTPAALRAARALHTHYCDYGRYSGEPWPDECEACEAKLAECAAIIARETGVGDLVVALAEIIELPGERQDECSQIAQRALAKHRGTEAP